MPEVVTFSVGTSVLGTNYVRQSSVTGNSAERTTPSVAAAKTGTLTTRTNDSAGTLTMSSGHGFTTGVVIDLFWSGGSRRNVTVGTVSTNSVPISSGSGDVLPAAATAITAMIPTEVAFDVDATAGCHAVQAACAANSWVVFRDASDTVLAAYQIRAGENAATWVNSGMGSNPLSSAAVANVLLSHGDSTQAQTVTAAVVY